MAALSTREKATGATSDLWSAHQGLLRANLLFGFIPIRDHVRER